MTGLQIKMASFWDEPDYMSLKGIRTTRQVNSLLKEFIAENTDGNHDDSSTT